MLYMMNLCCERQPNSHMSFNNVCHWLEFFVNRCYFKNSWKHLKKLVYITARHIILYYNAQAARGD